MTRRHDHFGAEIIHTFICCRSSPGVHFLLVCVAFLCLCENTFCIIVWRIVQWSKYLLLQLCFVATHTTTATHAYTLIRTGFSLLGYIRYVGFLAMTRCVECVTKLARALETKVSIRPSLSEFVNASSITINKCRVFSYVYIITNRIDRICVPDVQIGDSTAALVRIIEDINAVQQAEHPQTVYVLFR